MSSVPQLRLSLLAVLLLFGCGPDAGTRNPCTRTAIDYGFTALGRPQLDLLLVVDESATTAAKEALASELPRLLEGLGSGHDPEGVAFESIDSIHFGVISADLGGPGCGGDDALLLDGPGCDVAGWLDFAGQEDDSTSTAARAACHASSVDGSCSVSQPLEATLKALASSTAGLVFADGASGHGDGANAGFLRERSTLVVLTLTQQDDCSIADPALFEPESTEYPGPLERRCTDYPEALAPLERFIDGLLALRADDPTQLYLMPVAGVPSDLLPDPEEPFDGQVREALLDPRLQVPAEPGELAPVACTSAAFGSAIPPRRLLETAAELDARGATGLVGLTCGDDFSAAVDTLITAVGVGGWPRCLLRPFEREPDGRIRCTMLELVEPSLVARCEDLPGRTSAGEAEGLLQCEVHQVAIGADGESLDPDSAYGWVYDDFSDFVYRHCADFPQRLGWWGGAAPTEGASLRFGCLPAAYPPPPGVDVECSETCETPPETLEAFPLGLGCEAISGTCQPRCTDGNDCDAGWTCFDADGDGVPYCVNPSC